MGLRRSGRLWTRVAGGLTKVSPGGHPRLFMLQFAPDLAQPLRLSLGSGDGHLPVVLLVT